MTTWHAGRLLDHVHLNVTDLDRTFGFYSAILEALQQPSLQRGEGFLQVDELYFSPPAPGRPTSSVHIAFQAQSQEAVRRFHSAALAAGGRDNGGPGERDYHPGYYGAFVFDPDGNNIEAVYHGPFVASAESVVIKPAE